jgi:hypothetical protein
VLETLGSSIKVFNEVSPVMSIGDVTTIKRNKHGKLLERPPSTLHTVGMDIGYGPGTSPGGYNYSLTIVEQSGSL